MNSTLLRGALRTHVLIALTSILISANAFAHDHRLSERRYRIVQLRPAGVAPDDLTLQLIDLNNKGDVLLQGFKLGGGSQRPYLWHNGKLIDYTDRIDPNSPTINPMGINDRGEIVGLNNGVAFRYARGRVFPILPPGLVPDSTLLPIDINNRGQILGVGDFVGRIFGDTFVLSGKHVTFLAEFNGDFSPVATAMNDRGMVTGLNSRGPVIWDHGTVMPIPMPANAIQAEGQDINNRGDVVGITDVVNETPGGNSRLAGFLWRDGETHLLASPSPEWHSTGAASINDCGDISGFAAEIFSSPTEFATLWVDEQPFDLNTLIADDDPLKPYVHLSGGFKINNEGEIAAFGIDSRLSQSQFPNYVIDPYLLVPVRSSGHGCGLGGHRH